MDRVVRAFPLLAGKREAFRAFTTEVQSRRAEADRFYRIHGVTRESWHLQSSPQGDLVICCTELEDAGRGAAAYAASTAPFETWFKGKVLELCGVDPNQQPLGPDCVCVFDWRATQ